MSEIGNYYEPYRRSQRELTIAQETLQRAKELEQRRENLVKKGKLKKQVTYDPMQKLTSIKYLKTN